MARRTPLYDAHAALGARIVDFDGALGVAGLITPSRGGVGPLTITMLLHNTLQAYRARVRPAGA